MRERGAFMSNEIEKEIDMINLLFRVLSSWKKIIVAALVGAVLFAGFMLAKESTPKETTESEKQLEQRIMAELVGNKLEYYENEYNDRLEYINNSIYFNLNENAKPVATAVIAVSTDAAENGSSIAQAYTSTALQMIDWSVMSESTGVAPQYLEELLQIDMEIDATVFSIRMSYTDVDTAEKLLNEVISQILELKHEYIKVLGAHELNVISISKGITVDFADVEKKDAFLAGTQKAYDLIPVTEREYDKYKQVKSESLSEEQNPVMHMVKSGVIGAVCFAFIYACIITAAYILSDSIKTGDEIKRCMGIHLLGTIDDKQYKNHMDMWTRKLRSKNIIFTHEQSVERCGINIRNLRGQAEKILVTGCADVDYIQQLCGELSKHITEGKLIPAGNINTDINAIDLLNTADAVVFVEKIDVSNFKEIAEEIETIKTHQKPIIGYIAIQ